MSLQEHAALKQLLLKYPGLMQSTDNKFLIFGNIKIQNKWYRLRMVCPDFPGTKLIKLSVSTGLLLTTFESKHFDPEWTIHKIFEELPNLLTAQDPPKAIDSNPHVYAARHEILQLKSPSYTIHTDSNYTIVRFSKFDRFKGHYLELKLNNNHKFVVSDHSLPSGIQWEELFRTSNSIECILTQFCKFLEELREFYTNLTDIDELCYVVQPLCLSTKHNWRIFQLKDKVFVKLVLDPFTSSPVLVNILGPTYEVESLRHVLCDGLRNWDSDMDVHANLLRTFELTYFPMRGDNAEEFCNICYCYQLEGDVPYISCDNRNCSLVFHAICLKEWFNTLTDGKMFLDVAFGVCPYCKEKLSTSFVDLLK